MIDSHPALKARAMGTPLVMLIFVFLSFLTLATPALASEMNATGTRNQDRTISIRWDKTFQDGGNLSISYKYPGNWAWIDLGTVPVNDGVFVHTNAKGTPDTDMIYRIVANVYTAQEITVGKYIEKPTNDVGETDPGGNQGDNQGGKQEGPFAGIYKGNIAEVENNAGYIERFLSEIVMLIPRFINSVIGIDDPMKIVFNRDPANGMAPLEGLQLYTFNGGEYAAIGMIYETLRKLVPIPLVIVVALIGVLMLLNTTSSNSRLTYQDYMSGLLVCVLLLEFGHYLWEFIFGLNYFMVEAFYSTIEGRLMGTGMLDSICRWDTASFGVAIISFIAVLSLSILTWQYALRKIMLAILILIFPVVAIAGVFPQTRGTLTLWLKELLANVFMQTGHAAAFALFLLFISKDVSFWMLLAFLLGMNSIATLVRRVIGAESHSGGAMGNMGAMLGMGALLSLSKMGTGLMGKKAPGMGSELATGAMAGVGGAAVSTATGSVKAGLTKSIMATTAGLAGGALAGMATGNPGMGLMAGGALGLGVAGKVGQLSDFIGNVKQDAGENGKSFLGAAANRLGIFNGGQLYDGESAAGIGRNMLGGGGLLGGAGALAGRVASGAANLSSYTGLGSKAAERGQALGGYRQQVTQGINQAQRSLTELKPQYEAAKLQMEKAKSPALYPDVTTRKAAVQSAYDNMYSLGGQIADAKLTIMDGNHALSNEGIRTKLEQIRVGQTQQSNGGVNGFNWNSGGNNGP